MILERMPAILWTTDKELRYTSSMGAALDSLGVKSGGLTGKTLPEYFQTDDPQHPPSPHTGAPWQARRSPTNCIGRTASSNPTCARCAAPMAISWA